MPDEIEWKSGRVECLFSYIMTRFLSHDSSSPRSLSKKKRTSFPDTTTIRLLHRTRVATLRELLRVHSHTLYIVRERFTMVAFTLATSVKCAVPKRQSAQSQSATRTSGIGAKPAFTAHRHGDSRVVVMSRARNTSQRMVIAAAGGEVRSY